MARLTGRGASNSNARGNSRDRAARRRWLVTAWPSDVPGFCRCYRCGKRLDEDSVTADRIVPGAQGGRYVRSNLRPACAKCNAETGGAVRSAA